MEPKIIVIAGPTCSGKTSLSLNLSEKVKSEIISADSRQFYRHLNIGTAKPTKKELRKVKHHLIDFLEPIKTYNASMFEKDAILIIEQIIEKDKIPIVVGGSGLYIKALVDGIFDNVETDNKIREELLNKKKKFGNEYLFEELKKVDPKSALNLLPQNWKRIIRALEVYKSTGKPIWKHQEEYKREIDFNFLQFGLNWDRTILYKNIEARVDKMIELGLVNEVKQILDKGISANCNSLNTVGYKEIIEFLNNNITLERAIELIKRNTRRYAKRQMTWFRKDERIKWFDVKSANDFPEIAGKILKNI
ncbi:MAG: tRNA (adenosine(37)-N6)-dimethylallyltransferase MiaA [Ignavibacteriae bacterium]|nr:MAG: tRNA (adenosine(37)-N6)-dimethylallyltransferase MiaA [Ignavibacteriota bacterium]